MNEEKAGLDALDAATSPEVLAATLRPLAPVLAPLAQRFEAAGHRLYLVGGIVRDLLLGEEAMANSYDVDLTTDARPKAIKAMFGSAVGGEPVESVWSQGERFGTIGARVGGLDLEVTTHRAEAYEPDSRKPAVSFGTDLNEDLSRRDFTINAMAIELRSYRLCDPYRGASDLAAKQLRTPLSPDVSFSDDPLRVLRAARFIARFDLVPTAELVAAATEYGPRLEVVSVERIAMELERLLALPDPTAGLRFLTDTGLLVRAIPALAGVSAEQRTEACSLACAPGSPLVRRAGLLWPLGPGAAKALSGLRYANQQRNETANLIKALALALETPADMVDTVDTASELSAKLDAGLRRAAAAVTEKSAGPNLPDLRQALINLGAHATAERLGLLSENEDLSDLLSPLTGAEIMQIADIEPGPVVGQAQRYLTDQRLELGPMEREEAERLVREWLGREC